MNKSSIFVWGVCFLLLGAFIGVSFNVGIYYALVVLLITFFLAIRLKHGKLKALAILLVFFLLGFLKAEISSWNQSTYTNYYDKKVYFKGYIVKDPETYKQKFKRITLKPDNKKQLLLTTLYTRDQYFYGDYVFVSGKIKEPNSEGDFNYKRYLESKNIYAQISSPDIFVLTPAKGVSFKYNPAIYWSLKFKHWVYQQFQQRLPKEQAGLLVSLLVGQKELLSEKTITEFTKAGLAHIIAVSGFTLTLILLFCNKLGVYIGKKKAWAICLAVAFLYIVMADFAAGVIRAALMSGIFVIGKSFGRQYALLPALALTAGLLVLQNPLIIKYDIGFMLSFLSILGILFFVPLIEMFLEKLHIPKKFEIQSIIATTLAAEISTIPLTLYFFQQFSVVAPISNLLILPLLPVCLALGYLVCLPLIGFLTAKLLLIPLSYSLFVVSKLAAFKYSTLNFGISSSVLVVTYIGICLGYVALKRRLKDS